MRDGGEDFLHLDRALVLKELKEKEAGVEGCQRLILISGEIGRQRGRGVGGVTGESLLVKANGIRNARCRRTNVPGDKDREMRQQGLKPKKKNPFMIIRWDSFMYKYRQIIIIKKNRRQKQMYHKCRAIAVIQSTSSHGLISSVDV